MITEVDQIETAEDDGFALDVRLIEATDAGALVYTTDDGCGSTCGACTTGFC